MLRWLKRSIVEKNDILSSYMENDADYPCWLLKKQKLRKQIKEKQCQI